MEAKHTLGPWSWIAGNDGYPTTDLIGRDGKSVMQIYESHGGGDMPTDDDARLIAAAPELLEALLEARTDLANTRANVMVDLNKYDNLRWEGVPEALKDRIAIIDAAIAKATQP